MPLAPLTNSWGLLIFSGEQANNEGAEIKFALIRQAEKMTMRNCVMSGLTPELSRPAAGRRLGANIAEGVHLGAALMWARLE